MSRRWILVALILVVILAGVGYWLLGDQLVSNDKIFQQGLAAVKKKDLPAIERACERLEARGQTHDVYLLRGETYHLRGKPAEAIKEWQQIPDPSPHYVAAQVRIGELLTANRQYRDAAIILTRTVERDPDQPNAHGCLGQIFFDLGDLARARHHLEELTRLKPQDSTPYRIIGIILLDMESFEEAYNNFEKSLSLKPSPSEAARLRVELAKAAIAIGKYERALEVLSEAEDSPQADAMKARALMIGGKLDEASQIADASLEKNRRHSELLMVRGEIALNRDQAADAVNFFERALAVNSADDQACFQMSKALSKLGKKEEADRYLKRMKEIQDLFGEIAELNREAMARPLDIPVRLKLAELCEKINRPEIANDWRRAAEAIKR